MSVNTTQLLAAIDLKAELAEGKFQPEELLALAYDCLIAEVQPLINGIREEYYVSRSIVPIIGGKSAYRIPDRAAAQKLREVKILKGPRVQDVPQMVMEDRTTTDVGEPKSFYLESGYVKLYPTPASTQYNLELAYYLRCSKLVQIDEVAVVSSIDRATGIIIASCPSNWSTSDSFDLVSRKNSGESLGRDLMATSVSLTDITFAPSNISEDLAVGDYISLAGETFVVQIMDEAMSYLTQLTVLECLMAQGAQQEAQLAQAKAEALKAQLITMLTSRVIGAPKRFSPKI